MPHPAYDMAVQAANVEAPQRFPWLLELLKTRESVHPATCWKLCELSHLLDRFLPASVLELGTGLTTAVFCRSMRSPVVTVDENPEYQAEQQRLLPIDAAECCKSFVIRNDRECHYAAWGSTSAPELVYVDGPDNSSPNGDKLECIDAERIVDFGWRPRWFVFDQRLTSASRFLERCGDIYACEPDCRVPVQNGTPWWLAGLRYHTIFTLRT